MFRIRCAWHLYTHAGRLNRASNSIANEPSDREESTHASPDQSRILHSIESGPKDPYMRLEHRDLEGKELERQPSNENDWAVRHIVAKHLSKPDRAASDEDAGSM